ncbi:MAG: EAL domain-containing protein [Oscillospiraceae bacterium]
MEEKGIGSTTVDGVRAIEIRYRQILRTDTRETAFYQSRIRLNGPDMGVLLLERFLPVLERSEKCVPVFLLSLLQLIKAAEKFTERELYFDWISIVMPLRILFTKDCVNIITDFMKKINASPEQICFEIPAGILDERRGSEQLAQLRRAGFHTMLAGVNAERFPMQKLSELQPEYVLMDRSIMKMLGENERAENCVKSLISFVNSIGAEPIATGVMTNDEADMLYDLECSYFTADENSGENSGRFVLERYVRKKD